MIGISKIIANISQEIGQMGGAAKKVKPVPLTFLLPVIIVAYLLKTYIVYVSYNSIAPKLHEEKYEPITFGEAFMLILLVIGLLF
tara:strand:+ start:10306 stop:10560 length:255 start_codon:yes stop_codon:yes gene_type:complete